MSKLNRLSDTSCNHLLLNVHQLLQRLMRVMRAHNVKVCHVDLLFEAHALLVISTRYAIPCLEAYDQEFIHGRMSCKVLLIHCCIHSATRQRKLACRFTIRHTCAQQAFRFPCDLLPSTHSCDRWQDCRHAVAFEVLSLYLFDHHTLHARNFHLHADLMLFPNVVILLNVRSTPKGA